MYTNNYKEQAGRRSDASFHENPHEPPTVPTDVLKSTTAPHWNLPRLDPLPYGGYLGQQHVNNQIIQDGHYTSCANRPHNTNQRIIRPTARINCQSNCNGHPYCNHTPRGPHQWNLPAESPTSVVCKTVPPFSVNDPRAGSSRAATNVESGIDFSRYPREGGSTLHVNIPTYKDAVAGQERTAIQMPSSETLSKKDSAYDCQANLMPNQTSCKYPVASQLPLNLPQPQPSGSWIPGSNNQPQTDFWALQGESRRMMSIDGNMPSKYWMPKKNDVSTNRHEQPSRFQDVYNYQVTYQHQKRLEGTENIKQFQDTFGKNQSEPIDWSNETTRSSNIVPPYTIGRYPDPNRNNSQNSQPIGSHNPLLPLESYAHNKLQTSYDSPHLHSRLTGHSAYPHSTLTKGSYFDPRLQPAHSKSYIPLNLENQSHLNSSHSEPVTTQAGTRVYVGNMQSYLNPTLNNACNEMYDGGNYGQSMQVVDNPCPPTNKTAPTYERDIPHLYENMLHQNSNNLTSNMFYDNKMSKPNGYNSYYGSSAAESLQLRNSAPFGMIPQSNLNISAMNPPHPLTLLENPTGGTTQPTKKRKSLIEENLTNSSSWATVTRTSDKTPILDVRQFLSTWDENEESDLTNPGLPAPVPDPPSSNKPEGVLIPDCTNMEGNSGTVSHEDLPNTKSQESGVIHMYKVGSQNSQAFSSVIKPIKDCQTPLELTHPKHKYRYTSIQEAIQPKDADAEKIETTLPESLQCKSDDGKINSKHLLPADNKTKHSFTDSAIVSHLDALPNAALMDGLSVVGGDVPQLHSKSFPTLHENSDSTEQDADEMSIPQLLEISQSDLITDNEPNESDSVKLSSAESLVDGTPTLTPLPSTENLGVTEESSKPCSDKSSIETNLMDQLAIKNDQQTPGIPQSKKFKPNSNEDKVMEIFMKLPDKLPEPPSDSVIKYVASDIQNEDSDSVQYVDQELSAVDLSCRSLNTNEEKTLYEPFEEIPMPTLEPIAGIRIVDSDHLSEDEEFNITKVVSPVVCSEYDGNSNTVCTTNKTVWSHPSDLKSSNSLHTEAQTPSDQSAEFELELHASYDGSYFQSDSSVDDQQTSKESDLFPRIKSSERRSSKFPESLMDFIKCAEEKNKARIIARNPANLDGKLRSVRIPNRNKPSKLCQDNEKNIDSELGPKDISHCDKILEKISVSSPIYKSTTKSMDVEKASVSMFEDKSSYERSVDKPAVLLLDPKATEESVVGHDDDVHESANLTANRIVGSHISDKSREDSATSLVTSIPDETSKDLCSDVLHEPVNNTNFESSNLCEKSTHDRTINLKLAGMGLNTDKDEQEVSENMSSESGLGKSLGTLHKFESNVDLHPNCHKSFDAAKSEVSEGDESIQDPVIKNIAKNLKSKEAEITVKECDKVREAEKVGTSKQNLPVGLVETPDDFDTSCTIEEEEPIVRKILNEGIVHNDQETNECPKISITVEEECQQKYMSMTRCEEKIGELDNKVTGEGLDLEPACDEEIQMSPSDSLHERKEVEIAGKKLVDGEELTETCAAEGSIEEKLGFICNDSNENCNLKTPMLIEETTECIDTEGMAAGNDKNFDKEMELETVAKEMDLEVAVEEIEGEPVHTEIENEAVSEEMETKAVDAEMGVEPVFKEMISDGVAKEMGMEDIEVEPVHTEIEKEAVAEEMGTKAVDEEMELEPVLKEMVPDAVAKEMGMEAVVEEIEVESVHEEMEEEAVAIEMSKNEDACKDVPIGMGEAKSIIECTYNHVSNVSDEGKQLEAAHGMDELSGKVLDCDVVDELSEKALDPDCSDEHQDLNCENINEPTTNSASNFNASLYSQSIDLSSDSMHSSGTEDSESSSDDDSSIDVETVDIDPHARYSEALCISKHSDSLSSDEESDWSDSMQEKTGPVEILESQEQSADNEMPALEVITELPSNSDLLEMPQLEMMSVDCEIAAVTDVESPVEQNDSEMSTDDQEIAEYGEHMSWPDDSTFERPGSTHRMGSVHNWPYLEEEVFSETPKNLSPLIETTCSGHLLSPYTNSDSEPEMPSTVDVPSQIHSVNSSSVQNEITNLKCRLSWDKIFNLPKSNGSHKELNETEFARRWSCVQSNNSAGDSSRRGIQQSYLHEKADEALENMIGLELGPAKIEVRLTQKPLVPEHWQVINGPKTDSMSSVSFGEENNNSEFDSRSVESMIGKSPIVLVKRIILKRRAGNNSMPSKGRPANKPSQPRPSTTSCESDDSSSNQKTLPRVIIKRMGHGTTKYQSFLRTTESEVTLWQPIVRLERRKSIEDLAYKLMKGGDKIKSHSDTLEMYQHTASEEETLQNVEDEISSVDETVSPAQLSHFSAVKKHSKETKLYQSKESVHHAVMGINSKVKNGRIEKNLVKTSNVGENGEVGWESNEECEITNETVETATKAVEAEAPVESSFSVSRKKRAALWKSDAKKTKIVRKYPRQDFATSIEQRATLKPNKSNLVLIDKPKLELCQACEVTFANDVEKTTHIKTHSYHCQRCNMAFKSQLDFEVHLSATHPHTKELHHCLLCKLCFESANDHQRHLTEREHQRLDLTQRWTIQRLFMMFSGKRCSRLVPFTEEETAEMTTFTDAEPGAINYYHQATPLQLAEQDLRENAGSTDTQVHGIQTNEPYVCP